MRASAPHLKSSPGASEAPAVENAALGFAVSIASAARILGLTWVGVRMLLIARRSRGAPELLLGVSFLTFSTLGVPLLMIAGFSAEHVADVNLPLLSFALALLGVGTACFAAFVWRVFRPEDASAGAAVAAAALLLVAHVVLTTRAVAAAAPEIAPTAAIGYRELILSAVMSATFAWGTAESFAYWLRLRLQHKLGLAEDADVRRMLLFALGCAAQLLMMGFNALATLRETNPLTDPVPALGITLTSLATGAAFALALGSQQRKAAEATA